MREENYNFPPPELAQNKELLSLFADPSVSYWLKKNLWEASTRDIVDALNDAELLVQILENHLAKLNKMFEES